MNRLASLACVLLLAGCGSLPRALGPKPDVKPVQKTVEQTQASVGKAREHVTKERESEAKVSVSLRRTRESLDRAGDSKDIQEARAALAEAEQQRLVSANYREWADTELANSWRYLDDAKKQITVLSTEVDKHYENERVAIAAVEKYKPIVDAVNKYWGLGAFAYGFKRLASHLLILSLVLGVVGVVVFFLFPAVIPFVLGLLRKVSSLAGSLFRKK